MYSGILQLLFWTLAMWSTAKFLRTENYRYFYLTGCAAGLAILSKYTGILFLPAAMLWLLSSSRLRMVLTRKEPWIGAVMTVFTVPILWWNYQHDWASFKHILFIGSGYTGILRRFSDGLGYHLSQFLTISPLFYLAIIAAIFSSIILELRRGNSARSLLLCLGAPLFLFGVMSFKSHAEANWGVMGYVSTGILSVMLLTDRENPVTGFISKHFDVRRLMRIGIFISIFMVSLVVVHAWIGLLPASIEKDLGKNDRIIWETRGWAGLGNHLSSLMNEGD
ncbi:MAG: glycosyltransferase family 39 protein, partial [Deltaproteobacteria bacterium]|nr:glycosyltransferase family 39 protein [Deltaproteobacteria bacterium]